MKVWKSMFCLGSRKGKEYLYTYSQISYFLYNEYATDLFQCLIELKNTIKI